MTLWLRKRHGRTTACKPIIILCAPSKPGYTMEMAVLYWSTLRASMTGGMQRKPWKTFMAGWDKSQSLLTNLSTSDRNQKNSYKNSKVAGFLFLQNILDKHWIKPPPIPILHKVGGDDAIRNLIFVTTHWDWIRGELNSGIAKERHIRLRLEPLLRLGARMDRFDMETETAWGILHLLWQSLWGIQYNECPMDYIQGHIL